MAVSPTLLALIDPADPADPIARQFLPSLEELQRLPRKSAPIPSATRRMRRCPGIVHRHPDRVLFKAVARCPVYCRFCFRREIIGPGKANALSPADFDAALAYIAGPSRNPGSDPHRRRSLYSYRRAAREEITSALAAIAHVKIVRWHTRVPMVDPERVTRRFHRGIDGARRHELGGDPCQSSARIRAPTRAAPSRGWPMPASRWSASLCCCKGVNDNVETLEELMRGFVENRIKPYYLHHPDLAPRHLAFPAGH